MERGSTLTVLIVGNQVSTQQRFLPMSAIILLTQLAFLSRDIIRIAGSCMVKSDVQQNRLSGTYFMTQCKSLALSIRLASWEENQLYHHCTAQCGESYAGINLFFAGAIKEWETLDSDAQEAAGKCLEAATGWHSPYTRCPAAVGLRSRSPCWQHSRDCGSQSNSSAASVWLC